jgi:ketosteroid isomerase-like protein
MTPEVQDLLDRDALRRLVERYATAVDHRDVASAAGCFVPEGRLRVGDDAPLEGRDAIVSALGRLSRYEVTAHLLGHSNHVVDGDRATGESSCRAHHVYEDAGVRRDWVMAIRYVDRYVRAGDGWRIEDRHLVVDWLEDRPLEVG